MKKTIKAEKAPVCDRCGKPETADTGYGLEPLANGENICQKCFTKQINAAKVKADWDEDEEDARFARAERPITPEEQKKMDEEARKAERGGGHLSEGRRIAQRRPLGAAKKQVRAAEDDELKEEELESDTAPEEGDYILTPSGPLGGMTSVSQVGGKFHGDFTETEEAEAFIKEHMESEKFWPNVWYVSDHGNVSPYTMTAALTDDVKALVRTVFLNIVHDPDKYKVGIFDGEKLVRELGLDDFEAEYYALYKNFWSRLFEKWTDIVNFADTNDLILGYNEMKESAGSPERAKLTQVPETVEASEKTIELPVAHIKEDGKEFDQIIKKVEEMKDEDKEALEKADIEAALGDTGVAFNAEIIEVGENEYTFTIAINAFQNV